MIECKNQDSELLYVGSCLMRKYGIVYEERLIVFN